MEQQQLREWWWRKQGLGSDAAKKTGVKPGAGAGGEFGAILAATGWARSVGGVGPYLGVRARYLAQGRGKSKFARAAMDAATVGAGAVGADGVGTPKGGQEIAELACVRGCTYVVPAEHFGMALRLGQPFVTNSQQKVALGLGVALTELERLEQAVLRALEKGPMEPEALREACGDKVRNLGEAGKKKGLTTTLPAALAQLQSRGEIRRIATNGRFDQQRYAYGRWPENPVAKEGRSEAELQAELTRLYLRWIGPATAGELQWFTGYGAKVAKGLLAAVGAVEAPGWPGRFLLPEEVDEFAAARQGKKSGGTREYALLSSLDGLLLLRRDYSLLAEGDLPAKVAGLADLPYQAIFDRGELVGFWEFDAGAQRVVATSFRPVDAALREAVRETEGFIVEQLGDARSFSLDSPKSREPRLAALREMGEVI